MKRLKTYIVVIVLIVACILTSCSDTSTEPLGHIYRVAKIFDVNNQQFQKARMPLVNIDVFGNLQMCEDTQHMEFSLLGKLEKSREEKNTWIVVSESSNPIYKLYCDENSAFMLFNLERGETYLLDPVDTIQISVSSKSERSALEIDWFYENTFSGELSCLSKATIHGTGKLGLQLSDDTLETVVVYEEYYTDGNRESFTYQFNSKDGLSLDLSTRYTSGSQYAVYRIPYKNGEYVFYLEFIPK